MKSGAFLRLLRLRRVFTVEIDKIVIKQNIESTSNLLI